MPHFLRRLKRKSYWCAYAHTFPILTLNMLPKVIIIIPTTTRPSTQNQPNEEVWCSSCLMSPKSFVGKGEGILAGELGLVRLIWQWFGWGSMDVMNLCIGWPSPSFVDTFVKCSASRLFLGFYKWSCWLLILEGENFHPLVLTDSRVECYVTAE